nr:MAG TPA: hypothetical protein [Caudoviricetes sp.]
MNRNHYPNFKIDFIFLLEKVKIAKINMNVAKIKLFV